MSKSPSAQPPQPEAFNPRPGPTESLSVYERAAFCRRAVMIECDQATIGNGDDDLHLAAIEAYADVLTDSILGTTDSRRVEVGPLLLTVTSLLLSERELRLKELDMIYSKRVDPHTLRWLDGHGILVGGPTYHLCIRYKSEPTAEK